MVRKVGVGSDVATRAMTKELEDVRIAPSVVSTDGAPAFGVVGEGDEKSGGVLGNAPGLNRDPLLISWSSYTLLS